MKTIKEPKSYNYYDPEVKKFWFKSNWNECVKYFDSLNDAEWFALRDGSNFGCRIHFGDEFVKEVFSEVVYP